MFPDEETATKGYEELASEVTTKCLTDALTEGLASEEEAKIGRVRTTSVTVEAPSDQSEGMRVAVPITGPGVSVEVDIDLVVVRTGRGVVLAYFVEAMKPFDETLRDDLTATVSERLSKALNA